MKAATVVGTLLALLMVAPLKLQACQVPRSRRARQAIEDATLEAAFQDATSTRLSGGIALPSLLMKLNVMLYVTYLKIA